MGLDEVVACGRDVRAALDAEPDEITLTLVSAAHLASRVASRVGRRQPWDVGPVRDSAALAERASTLVDRRPTTPYHPTDRRCARIAHERKS